MNHLEWFDYELVDSRDVPEIAPMPTIRSERAATIARWFGIERLLRQPTMAPSDCRTDPALLRRAWLPRRGEITFVTGPSGAGKSSILRQLRSLRAGAHWIDLNDDIALPDVPLVDCFDFAP